MNNYKKLIPWLIFGLLVLLCTSFYLNLVHKQQAFKDLNIKVSQQNAKNAANLWRKCQFPDNYAPLDREGWVDINKLINNLTLEARNHTQDEYPKYWFEGKQSNASSIAAKNLGKLYSSDKDRSSQVLPAALRYELDPKGHCFIRGITMSMLWNGQELKPRFSNIVPDRWSPVDMFVCYEQSCIKPKIDDVYQEGLPMNLPKSCLPEHEFSLTNYPDLTFRIFDCDIKNGMYVNNSVYSRPERLTLKNFSNRGHGLFFNCGAFFLWHNDLPVELSTIQSRDFNGKRKSCLHMSEASWSGLFFDEGSVFLTFDVDVLTNMHGFVNAALQNANQYIVKDKK